MILKFFRVTCRAKKKNAGFKEYPYVGSFAIELVASSNEEALELAKKAMEQRNANILSDFKIESSKEIENGVILIRDLWD